MLKKINKKYFIYFLIGLIMCLLLILIIHNRNKSPSNGVNQVVDEATGGNGDYEIMKP